MPVLRATRRRTEDRINQADPSRPVLGPMRVHFQLFSGYGESLIDYDWNQTTVGVGVTLNDLL